MDDGNGIRLSTRTHIHTHTHLLKVKCAHIFILSQSFNKHIMTIIPCEHDVLCGRGKYCYNHSGNQAFRKLIAENNAPYKSAPTKKLKMQIVVAIVDAVISHGGRFLSKDSHGCWKDGGKALGKKKAGNSLRDAQRGRNRLTTNISNDDNTITLAHLSNLKEEDDKNNCKFDQVEDYLLRGQTKIISSRDDSHQHVEESLVSLPEGNLKGEWINQLCIEDPTNLDLIVDWKNNMTKKDRINEYLDDCIVDELSRLLK
jgi:hypothetical protein